MVPEVVAPRAKIGIGCAVEVQERLSREPRFGSRIVYKAGVSAGNGGCTLVEIDGREAFEYAVGGRTVGETPVDEASDRMPAREGLADFAGRRVTVHNL